MVSLRSCRGYLQSRLHRSASVRTFHQKRHAWWCAGDRLLSHHQHVRRSALLLAGVLPLANLPLLWKQRFFADSKEQLLMKPALLIITDTLTVQALSKTMQSARC